MRFTAHLLLAILLPVYVSAGVLSAEEATREAPADAAPAEPEYVGPKVCMRCHFARYTSWSQTAHARATKVLAPGQAEAAKRRGKLDPRKDYRQGETCLRCHATGYGTESGYPEPTPRERVDPRTVRRAQANSGVTCEACHGSGSLFWPVMSRNKLFKTPEIVERGAITPVTETQCLPCHASPCPTAPPGHTFDFERDNRVDAVHVHPPLRYPH